MLHGITYRTPDFYCTKLDGVVYRFASERCALSWGQTILTHPAIPKPERALGFRVGTLLEDFKSGSLWFIDRGAVRRQVDYDAWNKHGLQWKQAIICSRKELELHEAKGDLE